MAFTRGVGKKVDFQRGLIYVPNSKTGNDYSVPMNEEVRATLLQLRSGTTRSGYVFVNPKTGKAYTDPKKAFGTAVFDFSELQPPRITAGFTYLYCIFAVSSAPPNNAMQPTANSAALVRKSWPSRGCVRGG